MALTKHNRMTVGDLRARKGKRQLTMLYVDTLDEAAAASAAGIDILSIIEPAWTPGDARGGGRAVSSRSASSTASIAPMRTICGPAMPG